MYGYIRTYMCVYGYNIAYRPSAYYEYILVLYGYAADVWIVENQIIIKYNTRMLRSRKSPTKRKSRINGGILIFRRRDGNVLRLLGARAHRSTTAAWCLLQPRNQLSLC